MSKKFIIALIIIVVAIVLICGILLIIQKSDQQPSTKISDAQLQEIKAVFAKKYKVDASMINFSVSQKSGDYLKGVIDVPNTDAKETVFVAKSDNQWVIAFQGIGEVKCELLEKYNFPDDLKKDCYKPE